MSALGRRRLGRIAADAAGEVAPAGFGVAQFAGGNRLLQATLVEEGGVGLEVGDGALAVDLRGAAVGGTHANADAVQILPSAVGEQLQNVVDALAVVPGVVDAQHGAAVDGGVLEALDQGPGAAVVRRVGVGAHVFAPSWYSGVMETPQVFPFDQVCGTASCIGWCLRTSSRQAGLLFQPSKAFLRRVSVDHWLARLAPGMPLALTLATRAWCSPLAPLS
jgi:hypothetical protein